MTTARMMRLAAAVLCLAVGPAFGWHGPGHERATRAAVEATSDRLPPFFTEGVETVVHCAVDPDLFTRPIGPPELHATEAPEHYFDIERLDGAPVPPTRQDLLALLAEKDLKVVEVGTVPYAIVEWTQRLSVALAEHRRWPDDPSIRRKCLVYAGILSHYAADLCQPLHTTIHYDGRVGPDGRSPHTGIHKRVDALPGKLPLGEPVDLRPDRIEPPADLHAAVVECLRASHALVDRVYALDEAIPAYEEPLPADSEAAGLARERLAASSRFVARMFLAAWEQSADITLPDWHHRPSRPPVAVAPVRPAALPAESGPPNDSQGASDVPAEGERIVLATYNIENMMMLFDQIRMPERSRNRVELFRDEEDLYEIARTINLPRFDADVICIQESASQDMLELFNTRWLDGEYALVKVFASNVDGQHVAVLARAGLEVLEIRDDYRLEEDPVDDPPVRSLKQSSGLGNSLFSRGPGFVKFRTPGGAVLWVGTTHVKSKYGNSEAVTRWRIRELQRTREICGELLAEGETDLLAIMGDFNDDFGRDRYEREIGQDAVAVMAAGEGNEELRCLTLPLVRANPRLATYHCEIKPPRHRSFIDHVFVSPALAEHAVRTYVVDDPIAAVASDHYPVVTVLHLPARSAPAAD